MKAWMPAAGRAGAPARRTGTRRRMAAWWRRGACLAVALLAAGCGGYRKVEVEVGHRGAARLDPFLAAGRFLTATGRVVRVERRWPRPDGAIGVLVVPASMLEARGYVDEVRGWVAGGGHVVCLFGWASAARSDWGPGERPVRPSAALAGWLREAGWEVRVPAGGAARELRQGGKGGDVGRRGRWRFEGQRFEVTHAGERCFVPVGGGGGARSFVSAPYGGGRLTLVADARPFRNRRLGEADHAPLLAALAAASGPGAVVIVLGTDVSFWRLAWAAGWPALVGLVALAAAWLWRALPRFGALEADARVDDWRDYRRHLDAVGGFLWRIDRGRQLLAPLRREVLERLGRRRLAAGPDVDLHDLAATISGVPRARVGHALSDTPPADPAGFAGAAADLQQMLERL